MFNKKEMEKKEMYIRVQQKEPLSVGNKTFLSADDFRLTDFDLEIARRELHETEETKIKSLKKLKDMLSRDRAVLYCTDDDFLLRYLRVAKFDCEKALKAMKKYYSVKMKYPHLQVISPELEMFLDKNLIRRIPYKNEEGCIIYWNKIRNWKPEETPFHGALQHYFSAMNVLCTNPCLQVNGFISFTDFQGLTASQFTQALHPSNLLLFSKFLQEIFPYRLKQVVLFNCNTLLHAFYKAIRPLIKKKIADRVVILGSDIAELHQYVNPLLLPKEYGGPIDEKECSIVPLVMDNLHYVEYLRSFGAVAAK